MYKYLIAMLCYSSSVFACDFCGCSPSVMNSDVLALQPQSSVGTSLSFKNYKYIISDANLKQTRIVTQSFFVSYAPKKWVDIRLSLPITWMLNQYNTIDETTPKLKEKKFGVGDLMLFSNFNVLSKPGLGNRKVGHIVNLGFGMSFPTGSKKNSINELLQDFNFGTQMVAFYFSGTYSLSVKNWSLVNSALIKINMYNKDRIKYGNIYSYQLATNYTQTLKKISLTPIVGIKADFSQRNLHNNIIQPISGGWELAATIGLQCAVKDFAFNLNLLQPFAQELSKGNLRDKTGFNCTFRYQIKRKTKMKKEMKTPISSLPKLTS